MKPDCRNFRARLADALREPRSAAHAAALGGPPAFGGANGLGWHRHVMHCAACRELLSEEEALDELLRSLPQPHLPRALAERVLSRLEGARRGVELDRLLDLSQIDSPPAQLAQHVLARVHAEQRLDRLLERIPAEPVPAGFERRILARLELARRSKAVRRATQPASAARSAQAPTDRPSVSWQFSLRIAAAVALASLAGWGAWSLRRGWLEPSTPPRPEIVDRTPSVESDPVRLQTPTTLGTAPPDDQLLASLEMFESWDLLASAEGLDASLATLDSLDEYLLDFDAAAPSTTLDGAAPATEIPAGAPGSDPKTTKKSG